MSEARYGFKDFFKDVFKKGQRKDESRRTHDLISRIENHPMFGKPSPENPYGTFYGWRVIGQDSEINEGISMGGTLGREAIVVDDREDPLLVDNYQKLLNKILKTKELTKIPDNSPELEQLILNYVYENSLRTFSEDPVVVDEIVQKIEPDTRVKIGEFMKYKVGQCRHHALLTGYNIEHLIKAGLLKGKISVDRNSFDDRGAHAWARYTLRFKNEIWVLDSMLRYVGKLQDANRDTIWDYRRSSDR